MRNAFKKYRLQILLLLSAAFLVWYLFFALPSRLFDAPYSTVLYDERGELLGAHIAIDGQWRFPMADSLPDKFVQALTTFEDRRFFDHPGVDVRALFRAIKQNLQEGRTVSGGSTLTMQTIRLSRRNPNRTLWEKFTEILRATRLEWRLSKQEILQHYAAHAPFGGNVVGLNAACRRYYGKDPQRLSWGEAATLAVLPNSPALLHPGRNRDALRNKRNRLLKRLADRGLLSELDRELAAEEPLPGAPRPLPRLAPHLVEHHRLVSDTKDGSSPPSRTTLQRSLQENANRTLLRHRERLAANRIYNAAALVVEVETGAVRAYVGNMPDAGNTHGEYVDIIRAPRSTGSILKPFLYAAALQDGTTLPEEFLPDVPTGFAGFRPVNFNDDYAGMISARRCLSRSLNIPFVHLLADYGHERFHQLLQRLGFATIDRNAEHYGLSLILGGAEVSLWNLVNAYTGMARTLLDFYPQNGQYRPDGYEIGYSFSENEPPRNLTDQPPTLSAAAIYQTFEAMEELERPGSEGRWQHFRGSQRLAWKTGTSHGFRDAWAVGVTPRYVVGVWVGNADGEGRRGLVGVRGAAPILFDIVRGLPTADHWFDPPFDELRESQICRTSGSLAGRFCPVDTSWTLRSAHRAEVCAYHRSNLVDRTESYRVFQHCAGPGAKHRTYLHLPPLHEFYYRQQHPDFTPVPPLRPDCRELATETAELPMQLIYPRETDKIILTKGMSGELNHTVFRVAHRLPERTVYWHLDGRYLGATTRLHEMSLQPEAGKHLLSLVDDSGNRLEKSFHILIN